VILFPRALAIGCTLLLAAGVACESSGNPDEVMAVYVSVRYPDDLSLDRLRFTLLDAGALVDEPAIFPSEPRPLDPDGESLMIYPPAASVDAALDLRVDGLEENRVLASTLEEITPRAGQQTSLDVILGEPARCGDRVVRAGVEECDDGNLESDDGCTAWCTVEPGYRCERPGEPCTPD